MTELHVLVAGGGLGGLCLANGLRRAGISVAVYEKDPSPASRQQGYRITLGPDGSRALRACLPADAYELFEATCGMPPPRTVLWDADLTQRQVTGPEPGPRAGTPLERAVSVNRLTLRQILLAGLDGAVRFGAALTGYQTEPGGPVTAQFADGSHATGDVLVAADGTNSKVRQQYLPHLRIADTALRAIYGKIPLTGQTTPAVAGYLPALFTAVIRQQYLPHLRIADTALRAIYGKIPLTGQTTPAVAGYLPALFTAVIGPDHSSLNLAPMCYPRKPAEAVARLCPGAALDDDGDYLMCVLVARRERFPAPDDAMSAMDGTRLRHTAAHLIRAWHPSVRRLIDLWDPSAPPPTAGTACSARTRYPTRKPAHPPAGAAYEHRQLRSHWRRPRNGRR